MGTTATIETLERENETWKTRNGALMSEIENLQTENISLREIIEVGKSTVETAKSISKDLAQEHRKCKEREKKSSQYLEVVESELKEFRQNNKKLILEQKTQNEKVE